MEVYELLFIFGLILAIIGHYRWKLSHRKKIVYQFIQPDRTELHALGKEHNVYNEMQNLFLDKDIMGS